MSVKRYLSRGVRYVLHGVPTVNVRAEVALMNQNARLVGRRIVITGGGRGLGFAMARKFCAEGAEVLIAGRSEDTLQRAASELGCKFLTLDVSCPELFATFIDEVEEIIGPVDTLVNNAGISLHEPTFFDVTPKSFDLQFAVNVRGAFFLTQEVTKRILERKTKGNILFISSETGDTMDCRPYGYTKVAVNSMVQGLAYLFRGDGIRVNAVAPGVTASDMTGYNADGNLSSVGYGQGRIYLPDEVAEVACFLISQESGCISGQIVTCNNAQTVNARWK